jgi:acyl dehydratase
MTTTTREALMFNDVKVGDELPRLSVDVTSTTIVLGALATRDWRPQHHDYHFATERNGVRDIFMSSPNQAAWFERYITDWTGPRGRLGRLGFRMSDSVFPGDTMTMTGAVTSADVDSTGCGWLGLEVLLQVEGRTCTSCTARVAVPTSADDNPWRRRGEEWKPDGS